MMDRDRAAAIHEHLLEASDALEQATEAMLKLDKNERKSFQEILFKAQDTLHFALLPALYDIFPELEPEGEPPHITNTLRWEDVALPDSVAEPDVDAVIADVLKTRWQKTAMVIALAFERAQARSMPIAPEVFGARLIALSDGGRIEGAGDLRKSRHSEVRLPPQGFTVRSTD